jgi:S1-C subfamily serine protease
VVTAIDGHAVRDAEDLRARVHKAAPGATLAFSVRREGKPLELTATLGTEEDKERKF